jgi:hypothetical protein
MNNLANTYTMLERHDEAAAMMLLALEQGRRALPADDPELGDLRDVCEIDGHVTTIDAVYHRPQGMQPGWNLLRAGADARGAAVGI